MMIKMIIVMVGAMITTIMITMTMIMMILILISPVTTKDLHKTCDDDEEPKSKDSPSVIKHHLKKFGHCCEIKSGESGVYIVEN